MKRVAIIGPESTGKSTLARLLAVQFRAPVVEEYARGFVESLNRPYTVDDILYCSQQQWELEEKAAKENAPSLFTDTDFILAKVWALDVFQVCPPWILQQAENHRYDLHLLTSPDLPFENDPVRENPHRRQFFFDWYKKELDDYGFPYAIISGQQQARLDAAIAVVEQLLATGKYTGGQHRNQSTRDRY